jgi:hypothetical protein
VGHLCIAGAITQAAGTIQDATRHSGISHDRSVPIMQTAAWGVFDQEEIKAFTVS